MENICFKCNRAKEISYQGLMVVEYECKQCSTPEKHQAAPKSAPVLYSLGEIAAMNQFPIRMRSHFSDGTINDPPIDIRNRLDLRGWIDKGGNLGNGLYLKGWELLS